LKHDDGIPSHETGLLVNHGVPAARAFVILGSLRAYTTISHEHVEVFLEQVVKAYLDKCFVPLVHDPSCRFRGVLNLIQKNALRATVFTEPKARVHFLFQVQAKTCQLNHSIGKLL